MTLKPPAQSPWALTLQLCHCKFLAATSANWTTHLAATSNSSTWHVHLGNRVTFSSSNTFLGVQEGTKCRVNKLGGKTACNLRSTVQTKVSRSRLARKQFVRHGFCSYLAETAPGSLVTAPSTHALGKVEESWCSCSQVAQHGPCVSRRFGTETLGNSLPWVKLAPDQSG